jgi:hypothetical protein
VSDKSSSGFQWLRDSSLQIIAALIGSSLLVTIITTVYSEINQPNISLNVIPHYPNQPADIKKPEIDYYEIIAKNDGKRQATNMSLSAYFNGSISNPTPYFSGEVISEPTVKNVSGPQNTQIKGSLLRWEIPRLAPGAMMIFNVWTTATKYDPYYITATFDEGSATYPVFGSADIESGRFPNILAGREDAQTIQRLLILFVVLCAISFTIAIAHRRIKEIIKNRREGRKWKKIEFDLFLAIPVTILSAILILYVCEEISQSLLLQSLIIPPLDATDGASIDTPVVYKGITYTQGNLLLSAGIFWGISFFARSLLSYFIAKIIIKRLYHKELPKQFLASASVCIMGVPLASSLILFFSKSTYSTSPVYLFSLFLALDVIRMLVLVLLIPKLTMKNNILLYYGLTAISLVAGLLQLLLSTMLFKTWWITHEIKSDFLFPFMIICLTGGSLQLLQIALMKFKEEIISRSRRLAAAFISVGLIAVWIWLLYFITSYQQEMLSVGLPIVLIGIVVIVLDVSHIGLTRVTDVRKIHKITLTLDPLETASNSSNTCAKPCFPVYASVKVKGKLKYNDSDRKVGKQKITFDNGEGKAGDDSTFAATTNEDGAFESEVTAPSHAGTFKMQAYFEGFSCWSSNILFKIQVTPPAHSKELTYNTRLRNVSLSVQTGAMNKDGQFTKRKEFKPGELITFVVSLFDTDENTPICGETNIGLMLYGVESHKVTNPLPPTDNNGRTYASVLAPSIASDGWIFQAYYPGNSVYDKANSSLESYRTVVPVLY